MTAQSWQSRFDELHQRAIDQAGSTDFGDDGYHEGFRVLLKSLDDENPQGGRIAVAEGVIVAALIARLQAQAEWKANPQYRSREIKAPLIIIGVPRTGTTALYNLLSQDKQFQGLEKWICDAPLVRPARETWNDHPQYQANVAMYEQLMAIAPQAMIAHGVRPDDVDECIVPMAPSFISNVFPSQLDLDQYDEWLMTADETPSYSRYKDVLRLVGLNDDRRWLLKNPSHVFGIHALLAVFPDACIVQTHRHPAASLASLTSLLNNFMEPFFGESIDRERRLKREAKFWAEGVRRTMEAQDRQPDRFVNVLQKDIRVDPLGVVRRIYDKFGLDLTPDAEAAMRAWSQREAENSPGEHNYDKIPADSPMLDEFKPYIERYGL